MVPDMTPLEIRIALLKAGTTQAAIARAAGCSKEMVCRVIDGKTVSDRIRRAIAAAVGLPAEHIWRSYYLAYTPGRRGRRISQLKRAFSAEG